jgi:hypothetical protein
MSAAENARPGTHYTLLRTNVAGFPADAAAGVEGIHPRSARIAGAAGFSRVS